MKDIDEFAARSGRYIRLPDGPVGHLSLVVGSKRPTVREVWNWLRQGRPRATPVVMRQGTITADVPADWDGAVLDEVTLDGWAIAHSFQASGIYSMADISVDLMRRYGATARYPDGRTEWRPVEILEGELAT